MDSHDRIRLAAVDMDGTLLNDRSRITRRTVDTIRAVQARGVVFAICTGRFFENVSILISDYGIECPLITVNGAHVSLSPFGACLRSHRMPAAGALAAFEALEELEARYYMFGDGFVAVRRNGDRHHSQTDFGSRMETEAHTRYYHGKDACEAAARQGIYKFYAHADGDREMLRRLRSRLTKVPGISLTQSSDHNIEVMPLGIDKASGLSELAASLGIPLSHVMAIGDHDNDLPMLRAAGFAVAMGNATPAVKHSAHAVTLTNEEDGVAAALERYVLSVSAGQPM